MNCVVLFRQKRYQWGYVRAVVIFNTSSTKNVLGVITQKTAIQIFNVVEISASYCTMHVFSNGGKNLS